MRLIIYTVFLTFVSCSTAIDNKSSFKVEHRGALKDMMHKGDISAKANLSELKDMQNLYALGALENLKGEVLILNSNPFNTIVIDSALTFDNSFSKKATLLVYVCVPNWKSINIPNNIVGYDELEKFIAEKAEENQIDINEPFPFLIEGTPASFDWHVINWKDGDTEHSHEKHIHSGLYGTIKNQPVKMLGFYSDSHHAIFTHHTTNMHMHVKTDNNEIAGHVDALVLGEGMILKLPNETN